MSEEGQRRDVVAMMDRYLLQWSLASMSEEGAYGLIWNEWFRDQLQWSLASMSEEGPHPVFRVPLLEPASMEPRFNERGRAAARAAARSR